MSFEFEAQSEAEARDHQITFRDQNGVSVQIVVQAMEGNDEADSDATSLSLLDLLQSWNREDGNGFRLTKSRATPYVAVEVP